MFIDRKTTRRTGMLTAAAAGVALLAVGQAAPAAAAGPMPESFAGLVERVSPAVVTITAERHVRQAAERLPFGGPHGQGSPFEEFFRRFGTPDGPQAPGGRGRTAVGLGSGFIIDGDDGYVVTNNHVIDGAENISIALSDGTSLDAELVGTDPKTDIALLKVESDRDLPEVSFGDSDVLKVGDWVVAVGNPFGLGGTVTAGIVSARSRAIGNDPLDDFIQTDAAINKGNSGGPMFDTAGNVMGVNTAIFSPTGGSVGIGFAVPANVAQPVIAQLRESGEVSRGWLGVNIQPVTPEIAEAMGLDGGASGALVSNVAADTPAEAAGLKTGDVITGVDGTDIEDLRDLPRLIAGYKPGEMVTLVVLRDGGAEKVEVTLGRLPTEKRVAEATPEETLEGKGDLGLALAPLTDEMRQRLGLGPDVAGAVVAQVDPTGPAAGKGLRRGDVITRVNGSDVTSPEGVVKAVAEARKGERTSVLLLIRRDDASLFVPVPLRNA